ncbi:hypothetical protein LPJ66_004949, partial [Kickxella alabastrina]
MSYLRPPSAHGTILGDSQYARRAPSTHTATQSPPVDQQEQQQEQEQEQQQKQYESDEHNPTYYDPVHSASHSYPWASRPTDITAVGKAKYTGEQHGDSNKHRLRRSGASTNGSSGAGSVGGYADSMASSSVFLGAPIEDSLPPSVFRLPGAEGSVPRENSAASESWGLLSGMTTGGR